MRPTLDLNPEDMARSVHSQCRIGGAARWRETILTPVIGIILSTVNIAAQQVHVCTFNEGPLHIGARAQS